MKIFKTEKKEQTFKEFVKGQLIKKGMQVQPYEKNENLIAVYGVLDLDEVSKEIVEYIHKTPIDKLFPELKIEYTLDSCTYTGGYINNNGN